MSARTWRPAPLTLLAEDRRAGRRDAQLPEALERLAAGARAGHSIAGALQGVVGTTPAPLGDELAIAAAAIARGAPVEVAIAEWVSATRTSADLELATTALALGARAGGEVSRALDRVAATLRERRELRGEARALATQARASAGVLTAAPLAFAGLVSAIEPGVVGFLITTPPGLVCLATGLALDGLGALWMARIVGSAA